MSPEARGRRPALLPDAQVRLLLQAVHDHPWAGPGFVQLRSGLSRAHIRSATAYCLEKGLVERAQLRAAGNPPQRLALLPAGAAYLGVTPPALAETRDALWRAHNLDAVRALLARWTLARRTGLRWALSPFTVPAADLRPRYRTNKPVPTAEVRRAAPVGSAPRRGADAKSARLGDRAYRALRLDALACLQFADTPAPSYLHVGVLFDPGYVHLSWYFHQIRSFVAWVGRTPLRGSAPVCAVIAANELRKQVLLQLWRGLPRWRFVGQTRRLYVATRAELFDHDQPGGMWTNQRGERVTFGAGAAGSRILSDPPLRSGLVRSTGRPTARRSGVLACATSKKTWQARLVRAHVALGHTARRLLQAVARAPLLTPAELALMAALSADTIYARLREMIELELVWYVHHGVRRHFVISGRGIALLAVQAGFAPAAYARLRRWAVTWEGHGTGRELVYTAARPVANFRHTRLGAEFMLGLLRAQPTGRVVQLETWDSEYLYMFPARRTVQSAHVVPDAFGTLRVDVPVAVGGAQSGADTRRHSETEERGGTLVAQTDFWLEVDRASVTGAALRRKLVRYYRARGGGWSTLGWLPRLLVLVDADEARVQALRRRFVALDREHGHTLDALLVRVDQLAEPGERLDPLRRVWRRPADMSRLCFAFDGLRADG